MKLVFAGTPEFAAIVFDALLRSEHSIAAALTRPDARSGRGRKRKPCAVKERALDAGIETIEARSLRDPDTVRTLSAIAPDALAVASYGLLLPPRVLTLPRFGCINVHPSLLPRWRGAAPINHAILAGDRETGVSIMQMDAGLDSGPILHRQHCPIEADDTAGSLSMRLARLGARALIEVLDRLDADPTPPSAIVQDETKIELAPALSKAQGRIDWNLPATRIERMIRAFDPWPVAHSAFAGDPENAPFRIWRARILEKTLDNGEDEPPPGTVLDIDDRKDRSRSPSEVGGENGGEKDRIAVATGDGILAITEIQPPGGKRMSAAAFLRSGRIRPGMVFA
ncbi:methionyl-tRNA formyltransferase [Thioalkalivibrio sp. HK1]|uniref:methionyl-tRNA formyltransferase n=1 Tax=Thioalkalivibrio sp. HK1 TaxID=1469245 RepID=UPI00056EB2FB|nr:methionyl-tRNA formyltransferase [Thioalkalivibrio sp. HK1]